MNNNENDVSDETLVINMIIEAIQTFDNKTVINLLNKIPLKKLSLTDGDKLLFLLLSQAYSVDNKDIVDEIMHFWGDIYPEDQYANFYSVLFTIDAFNTDLLKFITDIKSITFMEVIDDLIHIDTNDMNAIALNHEVKKGCYKAVEVFGEQSINNYKSLEIINNELIEYYSQAVGEFLSEKLAELADYAEIPDYIIQIKPGEELPTLESIIPIVDNEYVYYDMLSTQEIIQQLVNFSTSIEDSQETKFKIREEIELKVLVLNENKKGALVKKIYQSKNLLDLQNNVELFRVFGPANPMINSSEEDLKYGGSRMLISRDFDYNDDTDEYVEWFNNYCVQCKNKIRRKCHSVRKPMPHGGWIGCYCSWECAKDSIEQRDNSEIGVYQIIEYYEKMCKTIGIRDCKIEKEEKEESDFVSIFSEKIES